MKVWLLPSAILLLAGCSKKDEQASDPGSVLTRHQWYGYSQRTATFLDSTNTLVSDTTVFYSHPGCSLPNYLKLNKDSSASIELNCMTLDLLPGACWRLRADSSFLVNIPFGRTSYATGYVIGNAGIQWCKLQTVNDVQFTTKVTEFWWIGYPFVKYKKEIYNTYKAR